jgi:hypothetical protein
LRFAPFAAVPNYPIVNARNAKNKGLAPKIQAKGAGFLAAKPLPA